jgi:hypothetical protein
VNRASVLRLRSGWTSEGQLAQYLWVSTLHHASVLKVKFHAIRH